LNSFLSHRGRHSLRNNGAIEARKPPAPRYEEMVRRFHASATFAISRRKYCRHSARWQKKFTIHPTLIQAGLALRIAANASKSGRHRTRPLCWPRFSWARRSVERCPSPAPTSSSNSARSLQHSRESESAIQSCTWRPPLAPVSASHYRPIRRRCRRRAQHTECTKPTFSAVLKCGIRNASHMPDQCIRPSPMQGWINPPTKAIATEANLH